MGTGTADGKGNLYKSKDDWSFEEIVNWKTVNGEVYSLINVNGTVYAETRTATYKENLYKN